MSWKSHYSHDVMNEPTCGEHYNRISSVAVLVDYCTWPHRMNFVYFLPQTRASAYVLPVPVSNGSGNQGQQNILLSIRITWGTVLETKGNLFGSPMPPSGGLEMSEEGSLEVVTGTCWGDDEADPAGD